MLGVHHKTSESYILAVVHVIFHQVTLKKKHKARHDYYINDSLQSTQFIKLVAYFII